ncbi:ABC transporter substrate-binding protein [Aquabacterium sp.]|uniref:ABC transporter substrate-binding protein n=1 Tax=Aquabacterium sp. TaxID=1872578 RepID=UPI0019C36585|nr:ABC transporter substrate-binding protein [Aquabacterium sp.]MBC7699890.1 ABC transporter substrate-binding protein [Aquabacterium sp.]
MNWQTWARVVTGLLLAPCFHLANAKTAPSCEVSKPVVFAGLDWASNAFHTAVAQRIIRDGYGCAVDTVPGSTVALLNGVVRGELHVVMEVWKNNAPPTWTAAMASGKVLEAGVNFADARQGWYVPRYLVEGPGALAPGLKSVTDLPRFKALFQDPEEPGKGRFYNCPSGWQCEWFNTKKLAAYGLDRSYTNFRPGTGAALDAAITASIKRQRPILFYYWAPSWLMGQLGQDLVMLQEPPFDATQWQALDQAKDPRAVKAATAYPVVQVVVGVNKAFADRAPQLYAFLQRYRTSSPLVSQALAGMQTSQGTPDQAAQQFLKAHEEVWAQWVSPVVAARVKAAL